MLKHTPSSKPVTDTSRPRPTFTEEDKSPYYTKQRGYCKGCKRKYELKDMHMDHIKSISDGGSDKPGNLQLLCGNCNTTKNKGTMKQLEERLIAKGVLKAPAKPQSSQEAASWHDQEGVNQGTGEEGPQ